MLVFCNRKSNDFDRFLICSLAFQEICVKMSICADIWVKAMKQRHARQESLCIFTFKSINEINVLIKRKWKTPFDISL